MSGRAFVKVQVLACIDRNPEKRVSAKSGKPYSMFAVHCLVDLGDGQRRVAVLTAFEPAPEGPCQAILDVRRNSQGDDALVISEFVAMVAGTERKAA